MSTSPARATVAAIDAKAILTTLAALEARVRVLEDARRRHDPDRDARLLGALAASLGSVAFTAKDLRLRARQDPALREALDGAKGRAIGAWLRRLHRKPTGPYALRQVVRVGGGWYWALDVCPDMHTQPGLEHRRRSDLKSL